MLEARLRSGQTIRYHTVPHVGNGQTVAEHAWRATVLLHTLWPLQATRNAVLYMLYHDVAEQQIGDLPAPTKWMNEKLAEEYERLEKMIESLLGLHFELTQDERHCCKMADMLELVDHTAQRIMRGNQSREAIGIYWNGRNYLSTRFGGNVLYPPAERFLEDLHREVVGICPGAAHLVA